MSREVLVSQPVAAILGTRYQDFSLEEEALGPLGVRLVSGDGASPADILAVAEGADVVLAASQPMFTAEVVEGLARLGVRGIVRLGVGTDSVDLPAARRHGLAVARVSDYGTEAVAVHAVAMALAQLRRLVEADRTVRTGHWGMAGLRPLVQPSGLTAGVVGFGRIGRQAASYLRGFGMTICAYDEYVDVPPDSGADPVTLDQLLERSDVVTLHAPGSADGRPLLGVDELARMRPGSVLVNTARGSLIDVPALATGLAAGRPARAALDVFPTEPPDLSALDAVLDQVLLSPHMAWYTEESEVDMRRKAAAEAARILRGEPLRDPVVESGGPS
jgi:phosphoglycerate dehydrogenase-like enzyme